MIDSIIIISNAVDPCTQDRRVKFIHPMQLIKGYRADLIIELDLPDLTNDAVLQRYKHWYWRCLGCSLKPNGSIIAHQDSPAERTI